MNTTIRPALETLAELDQGRFLDKLAVHIHDAVSAVTMFGRPGKIVITLDVATLGQKNLTEPVITIEADIASKLPKPEAPKALFFVDLDGNPTTKQQRQRDLGLSVAGGEPKEKMA